MLEGICRAGEVLFVPRGVRKSMTYSSANESVKAALLLMTFVLCCRVVASCCQPGGGHLCMLSLRIHVFILVLECELEVRVTCLGPLAGHHRHHAELRVSSQPATCVATSAKPDSRIRLQPCGAGHAARSICGSIATAQAAGAKHAACGTFL